MSYRIPLNLTKVLSQFLSSPPTSSSLISYWWDSTCNPDHSLIYRSQPLTLTLPTNHQLLGMERKKKSQTSDLFHSPRHSRKIRNSRANKATHVHSTCPPLKIDWGNTVNPKTTRKKEITAPFGKQHHPVTDFTEWPLWAGKHVFVWFVSEL